jgi:hypothetical protein
VKLIIATNSSVTGVAAKNALTAFLEAKGWSVWHWYSDLWLIDNVPEPVHLGTLRDEILAAIPTLIQILIMTTEGVLNHAGTVPRDSAQWFQEHWIRRQA